ncbi:hypothetical protein LI90_578 [Carbonactinospora thermoautotrophica]|uniref:Integral membrane protein n=2 Tax=Carbonactinospora thermoautotrophica TaxID=1469144 RepID=A0A132MM83_9ACTN|nr:EI24 domain-containing protein [Carbonactinospora thermoautotrophica]KWW98948.1 hypothetical protein LI90_578 [Carbonactinospora thermoautotrophica]
MREFVAGLRMFARGCGIVLRSPRLLLLGALPALLTTLLLLGGLVALVYWVDELVTWMTPFAADWADGLRLALRVTVGIAVVGAAVALGVVTFTALALLVGGPCYERIAEVVDDGLGGTPDSAEASWLRSFARGTVDSVVLVAISALVAVVLFPAGFIPVVGQTVVPVLGTCVGGWMLALELVGVAFQRRGLRLGDRHRALRRRRALTLGVGVPVYLLCAIPFAALLVMPAAVAAGTLLARAVLPDAAAQPARQRDGAVASAGRSG